MSRLSHVLVALFACLIFTSSFFAPGTSSQSSLRSLSLNGTNQYLTAPSSTSLNITGAITVEGWIKLNSNTAYQAIVSREAFQQAATGGGYRLVVTDTGKLRFDLFQTHNTYTTATGTTTITTGVWHHVAGVFDGSQMRVYVDGVLNGSVSTTSGPASGTGAFYIGRFSYSLNPYYFGGLIDEVRVSASALYTSNFTAGLGPSSTVRGLWKFDGSTANDFSTNGNHGTLQNSPTYSTDVPPAGPNSAPSVSLTHPLNNTSIAAGSNIVMDATASDSDGSVTKVDFYQGTNLLGTDTTAPFTFVWTNVPAGTYSLTAKATDDGNATTTSTAVAVSVTAPGGSHSLSLNGTNQYLTAPSSTSLNITSAITVEGWIKLNSNTAYQAIVSREAFQQAGTGGGYRLVVTDTGKLRLDLFQSHNTYTTVIGTTTITTGVWHHVAGVFDGSQMRVYLDGVLNGSVSTTSGPASGTGGFYIGRFSYSFNPYYFGGLIDEVRVSASALYTSNFTAGLGPSSTVRGLWKFDGSTANDFSTNGNHGTLQNGATYSTDVPPTGGGSQPPVAVDNGPYSGAVSQAVAFSSSNSFDPNGSITSYLWNFGDGTSATTANPSHGYAAPGLYTATLTVTDNSGLLASATALVTISDGTARLDPMNETGGGGENPLSRNFNWTLPLVSLPGRAGLDLGLSLSYNSLVWTRSGNYISFDDDRGFPSPGFRLGFPVIQPQYFNAEVGVNAFMLIGSDGSRTELRKVGATTFYEAADSSYLLLDTSTMILRSADGTQLKYELKGSEYQCTEIKDRNGNYITINYTTFGRIDTVIDTLGRNIKFNYDSNGLLTSITQLWNAGAVTHYWARFNYSDTTINTDFTVPANGPSNNSTIKTLSKVTLADDSHYDFSYTNWGQVWKISNFAADNHLLNYRAYKLPGSGLLASSQQSDCPRFTERRDWAENWNQNVSGVEQEAITAFAEPVPDSTWTMPGETQTQTGVRAQITAPDLTSTKIYFLDPVTTVGDWQRGLPVLVNSYDSSGVLQRQVRTTWTQDNISLSYLKNPRITERNTYDPAGNRARVQFTYQQATYGSTTCHLPRDVYEYAANATTILRSTRTDYHSGTIYTDRRIIGLVTERRVYEGDVNAMNPVLVSKIGFFYDNENGASSIQGNDAPIQHDNTNYTASFVTGRANLSSVRRYNVNNIAQFTTTTDKYNTAGSVVSTADAANHTTQFNFAESFSDGNNSRNTLAYPTTVIDPDGYTATNKYNFDFGSVTAQRTPLPNTTQNQPGPEQTITYDFLGRVQQVTNQVSGAYERFVYPNTMTRVESYATLEDTLGEAYSAKYTDGAGRVIATATEHPGSVGGYSGQRFVYDVMGRQIKTSNPTETSASGAPSQWVAAGDDAAAGWIYSQQTYDWKGRPLVTTNQDGTTKTAAYTGCGCAGGDVVTITDEGTLDAAGTEKRRQQKMYSDVLGRTVRSEILNWQNGSVYSATVNTYNARDQVTQTRQYAGAEGSGTYQDTTMSYDGYGRLSTRHVPEQDTNTNTVWTYNADDTVNTVTDARGAVTTYGYAGTNRHLVKTISHALSGSPTINVSFTYDSVGNRLSMTDSLGSMTYTRNALSQLTSETRTITGLGNFTLNYTYNLSGRLNSITDPFGAQVGYGFDKIGRLSAVTGANFASVTSYASNFQYRAWGGLKSVSYGNSKTLALSYNQNQDVTTYEMPGVMKKGYQYYNDGRLKFTQDQLTTNSKFDRLYKHDHVGRMTSALSGAEARGQGPTNDRPYNETMTYDAMGHLTLREVLQWDRWDSSGIHTYVNNRRSQFWQYDADGRLVSGDSNFTYDAAGRIASFGDDDPYRTDQLLDGDGRRIKSLQKSLNLDTNQWTTEKETYYIHSSVIGEVVTEVSAQGTKQRSFVFAGGQVMAIQMVSVSGQTVGWQHYDASNGSFRSTTNLGQISDQGELDPMGANAGLFKPVTWSPPEGPGRLEPYYGYSELNSAYQGCELDGIPVPCSVITEGNSRQCPDNQCRTYNRKLGRVVHYRAYSEGRAGYLPLGWSWLGDSFDGDGLRFSFVDGEPQQHLLQYGMLPGIVSNCISELYPMFKMKSFKQITTPQSKANDDSLNGVVEIQGVNSSSTFNVVSDPTPPQYAVNNMISNKARGWTPGWEEKAKTGDTPFWTYACPSCEQKTQLRPGEIRYPELYRGYDMIYFRVQIHELGAALTLIRNAYYPKSPPPLPPYDPNKPLDDGELYPGGHGDDGPAMEDCVGRNYYKLNGLTPVKPKK